MIFLDLVNNIALLVSLCIVHSLITRRFKRGTMLYRSFSGLLFGFMAVVGMTNPMHLAPGVIFDGRSIILSLAGLFGGFTTAVISAVIAVIYRLWIGGAGVFMGISVILESAGLGVAYYFLRRSYGKQIITPLHLLGFGIIVHTVMLALMFLLPGNLHLVALRRTAVPVIVLYPLATLLLSLFFLNQEDKLKAERKLFSSRDQYRKLVDSTNSIILRWKPEGSITFMNPFGLRFFGFTEQEIIGRNVVGSILPETDSSGRNLAEMLHRIAEDPEKYIDNENENMRRDGSRVWIKWANSPLRNSEGRLVELMSVGSDITDLKRIEQALRESEERYRLLFDHLISGFALHDVILDNSGKPVDYRFVEVNPAFEKWTGLRASELIGRTVLEVLPNTEKHWIETYGRVALTETPETFEEYSSELGRYYEVTAYCPRKGQFATLFTDVTVRWKAQEEIRLSEEKVRSIFRAAPVGIGVTVDGVIKEVNIKLLDMLGYTREDLLNKSGRMLYLSKEEFVYAGREMYAQIALHGTGTVETRWVRKDGALIDVLLSSTPLDPNEGVTFTALDITKRKNAEERLRLLASTVHQAAECVMITDPTGNIQYVNPAFERISGYSTEEARGKNPRFLKSGRLERSFHEAMWKTITEGLPWSGRLINRRKDGGLYQEDATISPVRDDNGKIVNFVAVKRDVTKELELEEQLRQSQKMEAIGLLAGGVAHDLNNLLTPILGYAEILLLDSNLADTTRQDIQQIAKAGQNARDLIGQLMAFGRKQTLVFKPLDLNLLIVEFTKLLRRTLTEDIRLELVLADSLRTVRADRSQLEQVLMNLAVNAQDAMPEGGTLTIETADVELDQQYSSQHICVVPGPYVVLSMSDNGIGMSEEIQPRIFEPFFTTKESGKGSGLGLSTVYGIVKQHGGNIWVYSEPGQGTTFKIYLPANDMPAVSEPRKSSAGIETGTETVLVAEDDPAVRKLVCTMLASLGYDVLSGETPEECLELARTHGGHVRLLLADVVMPEISGRELYQQLHEVVPGLRVLYMSGYTANVIVHRGVLEDGVQFLQKPFTRQDLAHKLRLCLEE